MFFIITEYQQARINLHLINQSRDQLKNVLIVFAFSILTASKFSQETKVADSLPKQLQTLRKAREKDNRGTSLKDTSLVFTLNNLSEANWVSDPSKAIDYAREALTISEESHNTKKVRRSEKLSRLRVKFGRGILENQLR